MNKNIINTLKKDHSSINITSTSGKTTYKDRTSKIINSLKNSSKTSCNIIIKETSELRKNFNKTLSKIKKNIEYDNTMKAKFNPKHLLSTEELKPFDNIITKYIDKKYKLPCLSKNLFNVSGLLSKENEFFVYQDNFIKSNKEAEVMKKFSSLISDEIIKKKENGVHDVSPSPVSLSLRKKNVKITMKNYNKSEMFSIKKQNESLRKYILHLKTKAKKESFKKRKELSPNKTFKITTMKSIHSNESDESSVGKAKSISKRRLSTYAKKKDIDKFEKDNRMKSEKSSKISFNIKTINLEKGNKLHSTKVLNTILYNNSKVNTSHLETNAQTKTNPSYNFTTIIDKPEVHFARSNKKKYTYNFNSDFSPLKKLITIDNYAFEKKMVSNNTTKTLNSKDTNKKNSFLHSKSTIFNNYFFKKKERKQSKKSVDESNNSSQSISFINKREHEKEHLLNKITSTIQSGDLNNKTLFTDIDYYFTVYKKKDDRPDLFSNKTFTNNKVLKSILNIKSLSDNFNFSEVRNMLIDGTDNFTKAQEEYNKFKRIHSEIDKLDKKMIYKLSKIEFGLN